MGMHREGRIGIYIRESRDDYGENHETIETQRGLLLDYARKHALGEVYSIYEDDNVSGSGFERTGIARLKEDVLNDRINILLIKDLSRLGRNNAKTLQFLDFLEEYGIRVLSSDGRYDSRLGDDIVGIETWANERYIRDISRKIRSSLHFKIQRGEYVGHAPFGYKKAEGEGNRLFVNDSQADTVRRIYALYLSGLGYSAIAALLDENGYPSPEGGKWNRITVRRILISSVYIGDTVQGVSERVSFKSKKTRRLPKEAWVVTEGTHDAIISKEEFMEVQKQRESRGSGRSPHKGVLHVFHGLIWCGGCGSLMYARKTANGVAYVCGNYCRNGKHACMSHFIYENELAGIICEELVSLFSPDCDLNELKLMIAEAEAKGNGTKAGRERIIKQLSACRKQQDMLYLDRLEGRISEQHFERTNRVLEDRLGILTSQLETTEQVGNCETDLEQYRAELLETFRCRKLTNGIAGEVVSKITVYEHGDGLPQIPCSKGGSAGEGTVVFDFRMK